MGVRAPCTIKKGEESCQTDCFRVSSTRCVIPSTVPSALWNESSVIIACSELGKIGEVCEEITPEEMASVDVFQTDEYSFKSFGSRPRPEYAVFVAGKDPEAQKYVKILAVSLNSIKQYYDEKYDRGNFIKNVILDNILPRGHLSQEPRAPFRF